MAVTVLENLCLFLFVKREIGGGISADCLISRILSRPDFPMKGGEGKGEDTCKAGKAIRRAKAGVIKVINAVFDWYRYRSFAASKTGWPTSIVKLVRSGVR